MATPLQTGAIVRAWNPSGRGPAHRRLSILVRAIDAGAGQDETLGERNRRLLRLHRDVLGVPLEARIRCGVCGVESEFELPVEEILGSVPPPPETCVRIESEGATLGFRLPRMSDLEAARRAESATDLRRVVIERCRIEGDAGALSDALVEELGRRCDAQDPAANVVVDVACSGCKCRISASVDIADFVARDLDRWVDGLYREIDAIASAYGWGEEQILALPAERRRRYLGLIAARAPGRAQSAARMR